MSAGAGRWPRPCPVTGADVALAATLHDAPGALAGEIERSLPALQRLYGAIAVTTSPPTAERIRALLVAHGTYAGTPVTNARGPLYRLALRRALATGVRRVHYLDFDRALHWVARAPRELAAMVQMAVGRPILLVGRTHVAHRSHHRPLYATETTANRSFATRLGLAGRVDFLVPSFVLDRARTARLLRRSRARGADMYGEWTALLAGLSATLAYVECRGLDWETPDRHRRAVTRLGLAVWRRRLDAPAEWRHRTSMAADFARGFERILARRPVGRVRLVRIRLERTPNVSRR